MMCPWSNSEVRSQCDVAPLMLISHPLSGDHDANRRCLLRPNLYLLTAHSFVFNSTMSLISLAIIGKNNTPLYLKEFFDENSSNDDLLVSEAQLFGLNDNTTNANTDTTTTGSSTKQSSCSLRQQFLLHAALDRFEQIAGPPPGNAWRAPGVTGTDAMFVGLLCPVEDMRIYGKTQTK